MLLLLLLLLLNNVVIVVIVVVVVVVVDECYMWCDKHISSTAVAAQTRRQRHTTTERSVWRTLLMRHKRAVRASMRMRKERHNQIVAHVAKLWREQRVGRIGCEFVLVARCERRTHR